MGHHVESIHDLIQDNIMNRQQLKQTMAEVIHLTPARQAEICYRVSISDRDSSHIAVALTPSLDNLTGTRIGDRNRESLYESMVFHTGLAVGNLTAWLDQMAISYTVSRSFPPVPRAGQARAQQLIRNNMSFIAYETGTWIELQRIQQQGVFKDYQYDSVKCHRDLLFVLEAVARDLEYMSNEHVCAVLTEYFDRTGRALVRQSVEVAAYQFVKNLVQEVVNQSVTTRYQAHTDCQLGGSPAEQGTANWVNTLFDTVITVLGQGPASLPPLVNTVPRQQDRIEVIVNA
jgi:hypothetical protein